MSWKENIFPIKNYRIGIVLRHRLKDFFIGENYLSCVDANDKNKKPFGNSMHTRTFYDYAGMKM